MPNKLAKIKNEIVALIKEIKTEITIPEGIQKRKMYHAWVVQPYNVIDPDFYDEINNKVKLLETRLNNKDNSKLVLQEIKKQLLAIITKINQVNGFAIKESSKQKKVNCLLSWMVSAKKPDFIEEVNRSIPATNLQSTVKRSL